MKKKKYIKVKGEGVITTMMILFIVGILFTNFIGQAMLQSNNSELQRLKSKIAVQEELSIQMKINELASLDNALQVADTFGLEYNNSNIKVISK